MLHYPPDVAERLSANSVAQGECLVWQGDTLRGYGRISIHGKPRRANRVAFEVASGKSAAGFVVRHTCDNPTCINPRHLILGAQLDNVRDMWERGRAAPVVGERNGRSKVTADQVVEIRRRYTPRCRKNGAHALAREFGLSHASVGAIVNGDSWKHIA